MNAYKLKYILFCYLHMLFKGNSGKKMKIAVSDWIKFKVISSVLKFLCFDRFNLIWPVHLLFSCQILALVFSMLMYCQILCAEKHLDWLQTSCSWALDGKPYHNLPWDFNITLAWFAFFRLWYSSTYFGFRPEMCAFQMPCGIGLQIPPKTNTN